jgi:signal transduction histidine kinase
VREAHDAPSGWQIVEQLTGLHGLPSAAAEDLLEAPDGSVWVTTTVGLVHVPARARKTTLPPPGVQLVDVMVDGERMTPVISPLRIRSDDVLELRFAALAYRDRGRLRHQYRLQPGARWNTSQGGPSVFQFPDLGPGTYAIEVRASLDGRTWSPVTSSLALEILPPWYRRGWALATFASAALMLLYFAYRLRVAFLLRLERQRTRIAMDLHDEIGSGLGSIHILAGLAAERTPPGAPQAGLVSTISETAAELGASLGEIVWSLRARSGTMEALISHLAERAAKLYPAGSPTLTLAIPDTLPPIDLPLSVRWNVALIAIEALHNAARHARATRVVLGLEPDGLRWKLWIEDDGHGPGATPASTGSGLGIESMKRRAGEIGADLTLSSNPAGGFRVALVFDPRAGGVGA